MRKLTITEGTGTATLHNITKILAHNAVCFDGHVMLTSPPHASESYNSITSHYEHQNCLRDFWFSQWGWWSFETPGSLDPEDVMTHLRNVEDCLPISTVLRPSQKILISSRMALKRTEKPELLVKMWQQQQQQQKQKSITGNCLL